MVYGASTLWFLVVISAALVFPGIPPALPVLIGIFPLAIFNLLGAFVVAAHFKAQGPKEAPHA